MPKKAQDMAQKDTSIRSILDKKSSHALTEWAELEGRSQQMHTGILLIRLARLFQDHPEKLEEIGLLTPHLRTAVA